jgi:hypothetical protein
MFFTYRKKNQKNKYHCNENFYKIPVFLISVLGFSNSGNFLHTQKNIKHKKTYLVHADAAISIENSYGKPHHNPGRKTKLILKYLLKSVSGDNENWVKPTHRRYKR